MKTFWIIKGSHAYKGYANIYSVKILHFFDTEPQHKDYESAIANRLIDLLSKGLNSRQH